MQILKSPHFRNGFLQMIPITWGTIPFGAVMGTVFLNAKIGFAKSALMNILVFAGASQLAAINLMNNNAGLIVVVFTGLVINLRFLLYSAGLALEIRDTHPLVKLFCAYTLTDQSYAVMSAHQSEFKNNQETTDFYLGTALCMMLAWHLSVLIGYVFGNFAPSSWSLDFAVPLSFLALLIPTLKNKKYWAVAIFSATASVAFYHLPLKTGLIATALSSILLSIFLTRSGGPND